MKLKFIHLLLIACLAWLPSMAQAQCDLSISKASLQFLQSGRYDVLSSAGLTGYLSFEVRREAAVTIATTSTNEEGIDLTQANNTSFTTPPSQCFGHMEIQLNRTSALNNIQISHNTNDNRVSRKANTIFVKLGLIQAGQVVKERVTIRLAGDQFLDSGEYEFPYQLQLRSANSNDNNGIGNPIQDSRNIAQTVYVDKALRIGLLGSAGRSQTVNLGNIGASDKRAWPVSLLVLANANYSLSFESENHGKLVNSEHGGVVPYALQANDQAIPLRETTYRLSGGSTLASGERISLGFSLSGGLNYRAGKYRDTLKISVFPQTFKN